MKFLTVIIITALATLATTSFAATDSALGPRGDHGSELFYQAPSEKSALTPGFKYLYTQQDITGYTWKATGYFLNVQYLYGLNQDLSLGFSTSYGSSTFEVTGSPSEKATGLGDIHLLAVGFDDLGQSEIHYGLDLGISPANNQPATSTSDGNLYSGGFSATPNIAWKYKMGSGSGAGVNLQYLIRGDRTSEIPAGNEKTSGGNTLTFGPFIEYNYGQGMLGTTLYYQSTADSTLTSTSSTASTLQGTSDWAFNPFVTYDFSDAFALRGDITYVKYADQDGISTSTTGLIISAHVVF